MQPRTHACPICGLTYDEDRWARRCQAWCAWHASCKLAIAAHSRERRARVTGEEGPVDLPE